LYIGHFGTIVVNGNATLGNNVNLSPGVVIGQASRGRLKGVPVVGNRVWIGSNAVIVGKVHIGDDVLIAPGAYVNRDVPANSLVMGNPGVVYEGKNVEGYILNEWAI
jgi:serine O-acetyltransferase